MYAVCRSVVKVVTEASGKIPSGSRSPPLEEPLDVAHVQHVHSKILELLLDLGDDIGSGRDATTVQHLDTVVCSMGTTNEQHLVPPCQSGGARL